MEKSLENIEIIRLTIYNKLLNENVIWQTEMSYLLLSLKRSMKIDAGHSKSTFGNAHLGFSLVESGFSIWCKDCHRSSWKFARKRLDGYCTGRTSIKSTPNVGNLGWKAKPHSSKLSMFEKQHWDIMTSNTRFRTSGTVGHHTSSHTQLLLEVHPHCLPRDLLRYALAGIIPKYLQSMNKCSTDDVKRSIPLISEYGEVYLHTSWYFYEQCGNEIELTFIEHVIKNTHRIRRWVTVFHWF